jgi:lipid-A-disaccharide synthase
LPKIRSVYHALLEEVALKKPSFALLLDYPDFNLRLARDLKKMGVRVVYYISPQVWAWRTGRVKQIARDISKMLVLFPFEKDFYKSRGVDSEFVGHPALDELNPEWLNAKFQSEERVRLGMNSAGPTLGLMPGSRNSEIQHHLEVQVRAAEKLRLTIPNLNVVLLLAPSLNLAKTKNLLVQLGSDINIIQSNPMRMISAVDVILCASGTATLMVGLIEKPMVIMYRMNWVAKKLVKHTKFFGMVNLVMDRLIVPELFQEKAYPELMALELAKLFGETPDRTEMVENLKKMKVALGSKGATLRVAQAIEPFFANPD